MKFTVEWVDSGREPQCPPNPAYPNGIDIPGPDGCCRVELPYPARRVGAYIVRCTTCGASVGVTTAGRPDDPRSCPVICRVKGSA